VLASRSRYVTDMVGGTVPIGRSQGQDRDPGRLAATPGDRAAESWASVITRKRVSTANPVGLHAYHRISEQRGAALMRSLTREITARGAGPTSFSCTSATSLSPP
jgi:hypothetical protein